MNDASQLDPTHADPRELMQALLPAARSEYIRAWEFLADPSTPLDRRRLARTRASAIAADHATIAEHLRQRESNLAGNDLHNARHLADELERHVEALNKLATLSAVGLATATALRPEALGCGKRYNDPTRGADSGAPSRSAATTPKPKPRESRERGRGGDRPFSDRGPKVAPGALGSSKHDSSLGDDLDEATRAKLEAMRAALGSDE